MFVLYCIVLFCIQEMAVSVRQTHRKGNTVVQWNDSENVKIIWIAQFFISQNESRNREIQQVIEENCANPEIDEIHLLNEEYYDLPVLQHEKIRQINIGKRMSYYDAFFYSHENLDEQSIKMVSNNDITFNVDDLHCLRYKVLTNKVLCLTRYEYPDSRRDKSTVSIYLSRNKKTKESTSQDTWIYTNITPTIEMDIHLGTWSCDNRIAYILHQNGYQINNVCNSIRTYHNHLSNFRTYAMITPPGNHRYLKEEIDMDIEYIRQMLGLSPTNS